MQRAQRALLEAGLESSARLIDDVPWFGRSGDRAAFAPLTRAASELLSAPGNERMARSLDGVARYADERGTRLRGLVLPQTQEQLQAVDEVSHLLHGGAIDDLAHMAPAAEISSSSAYFTSGDTIVGTSSSSSIIDALRGAATTSDMERFRTLTSGVLSPREVDAAVEQMRTTAPRPAVEVLVHELGHARPPSRGELSRSIIEGAPELLARWSGATEELASAMSVRLGPRVDASPHPYDGFVDVLERVVRRAGLDPANARDLPAAHRLLDLVGEDALPRHLAMSALRGSRASEVDRLEAALRSGRGDVDQVARVDAALGAAALGAAALSPGTGP